MIIAAKKVSQVTAHMTLAFGLMYVLTGSVAFGGLAAVIEPIINVALLPLHEGFWKRLRERSATRTATLVAAEKNQPDGLPLRHRSRRDVLGHRLAGAGRPGRGARADPERDRAALPRPGLGTARGASSPSRQPCRQLSWRQGRGSACYAVALRRARSPSSVRPAAIMPHVAGSGTSATTNRV